MTSIPLEVRAKARLRLREREANPPDIAHVAYQDRPLDWIVEKLEVPRHTLVWSENAGYEGSVVVEHVKGMAKGEGLNCATGEYGKMIQMGVNDPVKVTRSALQNAASIAGLFLTTEAVVADKPEPAGAAPAPDMGGMGGMM